MCHVGQRSVCVVLPFDLLCCCLCADVGICVGCSGLQYWLAHFIQTQFAAGGGKLAVLGTLPPPC